MKEEKTTAQGTMKVVLPNVYTEEVRTRISSQDTVFAIFEDLIKRHTHVEIASDFDGAHLELIYIKK